MYPKGSTISTGCWICLPDSFLDSFRLHKVHRELSHLRDLSGATILAEQLYACSPTVEVLL